jgi:HAD superfamily hydrolase (TIGR01509 family)
MSHPKVVLFDADGVLIRPPELFSHAYARSLGYPADHFLPFFKGPFLQAILGQADLKDLIRRYDHLWQWPGDPAGLLQRWFEHENVRNEPLLALVRELRAAGTPCYIATNQEKYRAAYLRTIMFPDEFDGIFVSCELGYQKPDPQYFEAVLAQLGHTHPGLKPADVVFFDDTPSHVAGAQTAGITAHVYADPDQVAMLLVSLTTPS